MYSDDGQAAPDEELTIKEAAGLAHRSVKTLRRAIQDGQLPRRYAAGPFGPQLVCTRADIEKFLHDRESHAVALGQTRTGPAVQGPGQGDDLDTAPDIAVLATALDTLQEALTGLQAALGHAQDRIARLEERPQPGAEEGGSGLAELQARFAPVEEWFARHATAVDRASERQDELAQRIATLESRPALPTITLRELEVKVGRLINRVAALTNNPAQSAAAAPDTEGAAAGIAERLARLEQQQQAEAASRLQDAGVREGLHARIEQLEAALASPERRPLWKRPR